MTRFAPAVLMLVAGTAAMTSAVLPASAAPGSPTVELSSDEGAPGTEFQATASGFDECPTAPGPAGDIPAQIVFSWRGGAAHATAVEGTATVTLPVRADAEPGTYTVTAECEGGPSAGSVFTVTAPVSAAALVLEPTQGPPGTSFTATATGFAPCRLMSIRWGDDPPVNGNARDAQTFTMRVPEDAPARVQTVTASCVGGATATAPFTVAAVAEPGLTLTPPDGPVGTQFTAAGTGFDCDSGRIDLSWDGGDTIAEASTDSFAVQLRVPSNAAVGDHRVSAACHEDPAVAAGRTFAVSESTTSSESPVVTTPVVTTPVVSTPVVTTPAVTTPAVTTPVVSPTGTPTATSPESPGVRVLPWVAGVLVLGGLGYLVRRGRRSKPPAEAGHFAASPHPGGPPLVSVRDTPMNGEATHAIRLEVHPDPGIQTLTEETR